AATGRVIPEAAVILSAAAGPGWETGWPGTMCCDVVTLSNVARVTAESHGSGASASAMGRKPFRIMDDTGQSWMARVTVRLTRSTAGHWRPAERRASRGRAPIAQ